MNSDIRVAMSCTGHPKILKLMRKIGDKAFWNLIKFWCFVAENKPDGDLSGYDIDDIEIGSCWDGESGVFYKTLVELKLIDEKDGSILVHDWKENQPWACGAEARSLISKKNQLKRWLMREFNTKKDKESFLKWYETYNVTIDDDTDAIRTLYKRYTDGNSPFLSSPLLSSPKDNPPTKLPEACVSFARDFYIFLSKNGGKKTVTEKDIQSGADTINKLIRLDKWDLETEIKPALRWGVRDSFWSSQVRSLAPLRKKAENGEKKFVNLFSKFSAENKIPEQSEKLIKITSSKKALFDAKKANG